MGCAEMRTGRGQSGRCDSRKSIKKKISKIHSSAGHLVRHRPDGVRGFRCVRGWVFGFVRHAHFNRFVHGIQMGNCGKDALGGMTIRHCHLGLGSFRFPIKTMWLASFQRPVSAGSIDRAPAAAPSIQPYLGFQVNDVSIALAPASTFKGQTIMNLMCNQTAPMPTVVVPAVWAASLMPIPSSN